MTENSFLGESGRRKRCHKFWSVAVDGSASQLLCFDHGHSPEMVSRSVGSEQS